MLANFVITRSTHHRSAIAGERETESVENSRNREGDSVFQNFNAGCLNSYF